MLCLLTPALAQERRRNQVSIRREEPDVLAPELYLDNLKLKITLIDLPGAADAGSYWEGTYRLYFVSEDDHRRALAEIVKRGAGPGGGVVAADVTLNSFPRKSLLAEGSFKKSGLATLKERTFIVEHIPFRSKVPAAARTKEARLLLSYSVKIFDARLKETLYATRIWNAQAPLMEDAAQSGHYVTRTTVYANFYVSETGDVYESQWTREGEDTKW